MQRRMTGILPSKANTATTSRFQRQLNLSQDCSKQERVTRAVFFVDASHFVFSAVMGMLWCFSRIWIKAASGRKRFNVLGALNAVTHDLITVTNDSYINAQTVCELLRKLAAFNLGVPITLVLDNARYQRCALVQDLALLLHIELLFLPAYSPNLNLIERYWKFVKKKVLYAKHYSCFDDYCAAIISTNHSINHNRQARFGYFAYSQLSDPAKSAKLTRSRYSQFSVTVDTTTVSIRFQTNGFPLMTLSEITSVAPEL